MIKSFKDSGTGDVYHGRRSKKALRFPEDVIPAALRKLDLLNGVYRLEDLRVPPGNRLEALKGTLSGRHAIRVNDQWRIVFRWADGDAHDVTLVDYH